MTNWTKHQRIDKPNKPRYPLPTSENAIIRETVATPSRDTRDTLATVPRLEQGNRGTGEQGSRGADTPPDEDHDDLDALADAHAQEVNSPVAPGVYGTPEEPRCRRHAGSPDPPHCGGCGKARRWFEKREAEAQAEAERQRAAERARADACPYCEGGWRKGTNPAQRCTHDPAKEDAA